MCLSVSSFRVNYGKYFIEVSGVASLSVMRKKNISEDISKRSNDSLVLDATSSLNPC
jgi:hypothetical protein